MSDFNRQDKITNLARSAGLLYLVIAVAGGFSMGYLPSITIVSGDAAATAQNILGNTALFRFGIFADTLVILAEVILTALLFQIFRPVNAALSLTAACARILMVAVMSINIVLKLVVLELLSGSSYLQVFPVEHMQAIALLLMQGHYYGVLGWGVLFGFHVLILGYLILKSTFLPRVFGVLLVIGSFGYSVESLKVYMAFESTFGTVLVAGLLGIVVVGELSLAFFLLVKGVRADKWHQQAIAATA